MIEHSIPSPSDLLFTIVPNEETWTIVGPTPDSPPHVVPNPLTRRDFLTLVEDLRRYGNMKLSPNEKYGIRLYEDVARELSAQITPLLLSETARKVVRIRLNQSQLGRTRLTLRVTETGPLGDRILALPWEVLAPDPQEFPVRESTLEIVRESVVPGAEELAEPSRPLNVAVAIAAPEDQSAFSYEKEEVRLQAVLDPLGHSVAFSDLGTLDDLVELVEQNQATAILFSGHGSPGQLLFENRLGFAEPVDINVVVRRLRAVLLDPGRAGTFPCTFFLHCCHGATSEHAPSTAAALHRAGFPQVIGFIGGVRESAASVAEQAFFRELARGKTALQAAHMARASLVNVVEHEGEDFIFPLAWTQLAIYHRGADWPVAVAEHKSGRTLPPRLRRHINKSRGIPMLDRGFVGRRMLQHEILRKVEREDERLIILHGLGGSGKTTLAGHLMTRRLALTPDPAGTVFVRVPASEDATDPILGLRRQVEEHGRRYNLPDWQAKVAQLRQSYQTHAVGFANTLRALRKAQPKLVIHIDCIDELQVGPSENGKNGAWKTGADEWWRELVNITEDDVLVLISACQLGGDFPVRSYVGLPLLSASDAFRMMAFFVELAALKSDERRRLAQWSQGHPRTIELIDEAAASRLNGFGYGYEIEDPWRDLIEPVLSGVAETVRNELRLRDRYNSLSEGARKHARRIASKGDALLMTEIDLLGPYRDELIRSGLLIRHVEESRVWGDVRWTERWGLPLRLCKIFDSI